MRKELRLKGEWSTRNVYRQHSVYKWLLTVKNILSSDHLYDPVYVCQSIFFSVCVSVNPSTNICTFFNLHYSVLFRFLFLSIIFPCEFVRVSVSLTVHSSASLLALSICLSVCLSACLSLYYRFLCLWTKGHKASLQVQRLTDDKGS